MLRVSALEKAFVSRKHGSIAVRGVSFIVANGEFFTLLGPSGCGKTTTLQCIAGLETPDGGEIIIDDKTVFSSRGAIDVPAYRRDLGMVFQSYAIWPHMTVFENVAFPLIYGHRRNSVVDVRGKVMRALELVKLADFADRPSPFLSGGQQQRVALARALVHEPHLLLLDEPLSNLDARLRDEMRVELRQLTRLLDMTTIYVTHDQVEALAMSDRIALMRDGVIVQEGPPREVYFRPCEAFVAEFLGSANIIRGQMLERGIADTPLGRFSGSLSVEIAAGAPIDLVIRAEGFRLCDPAIDPCDAPNRIEGVVESVIFTGGAIEVRVRAAGTALRARLDAFADVSPGSRVRLEVLSDRCAAVPATSDTGTAAPCSFGRNSP